MTIFSANIEEEHDDRVPFWLTPGHAHALLYVVFIRTSSDHLFSSTLNPGNLLAVYKFVRYKPVPAKMHIGKDQYLFSKYFQVYDVQYHQHRNKQGNIPAYLPENNQIFITVPGGCFFGAKLETHILG